MSHFCRKCDKLSKLLCNICCLTNFIEYLVHTNDFEQLMTKFINVGDYVQIIGGAVDIDRKYGVTSSRRFVSRLTSAVRVIGFSKS